MYESKTDPSNYNKMISEICQTDIVVQRHITELCTDILIFKLNQLLSKMTNIL